MLQGEELWYNECTINPNIDCADSGCSAALARRDLDEVLSEDFSNSLKLLQSVCNFILSNLPNF